MSEPIQAYPLQWPPGWRRLESYRRTHGKFLNYKRELSVMDGIQRVLDELSRLGVKRDDLVISTNVETRLDGFPRSDRTPTDPGVAVYWSTKDRATRCMAVDRYSRVADNLAAIAATLEAMRSIKRHGGAEILDRAFTGFTALPAQEPWFQVLDLSADATGAQIETAYRALAMKHHPDRGGSSDEMARINRARDEGMRRAAR